MAYCRGIVGWVASILMGTNAQQGILLNIIVGIVGAFVAGILLTPLLEIGTIRSKQLQPPFSAGFIRGRGKDTLIQAISDSND
jgi:uncharacterized membrane protein YeaQ/YmgE (transglycosylase-associated protein family)